MKKSIKIEFSPIFLGYKEVVQVLLANPRLNVNLINLESKTASEATSFLDIKKWIEMTKMKYKQIHETLNKNASLSALKNSVFSFEKDRLFSPEKQRISQKNNEKEKYDDLINKPLFRVFRIFSHFFAKI